MRRTIFALALIAAGIAGCKSSTVPPGPNPECSTAAGIIENTGHGLSVAKVALSFAETFGLIKAGSTVEGIITVSLNAAQAGLDKATADVALGKCDISSYIGDVVAAIESATAEIANASTTPAGKAMASRGTAIQDLRTLTDQANAIAEQNLAAAKAAARR